MPLVFDWTVASAAHDALKLGSTPSNFRGRLLSIIAKQEWIEQMPIDRKPLWRKLTQSLATDVIFMKSGWASGALRRIRSAEESDILVALGGGEGVEHLAQEFVAQKKPVIPIDLDVGAFYNDGSGGARRIAREILSSPETFLNVNERDTVTVLLADLTTDHGMRPIGEVVTAIRNLILKMIPPTIFYVRLLNRKLPEFEGVERFFRGVVDSVVENHGYQKVEMGTTDNDYAWMNEKIFAGLHFCEAAIVDLTGLRENCFMELGYALGRAKPVILTAQAGTSISFDASSLEACMWDDSVSDTVRIKELTSYWKRNIGRPPIVKPLGIL